MDWLDILERIERGEDRHTEYKRGLGDLSSVGRCICAFANTEGGVIILGVTDAQEIVGIKEDAEHVQERLTSFLQTGCSSPVTARAGRHQDPNGCVPLARGSSPARLRAVTVRRSRVGASASVAVSTHRRPSFKSYTTLLGISSLRNARYKLLPRPMSISRSSAPILRR